MPFRRRPIMVGTIPANVGGKAMSKPRWSLLFAGAVVVFSVVSAASFFVSRPVAETLERAPEGIERLYAARDIDGLTVLAQKGEAWAQLYLGEVAAERHTGEAIRWWTAAAEQNNQYAIYRLSAFYKGEG